MIKYEYALDGNGNLVHYMKARKGVPYYCLECGGEMIKCKGDILEYFRHKNMSDSVVYKTHDYNGYLHKLAELYISERCKDGKLIVRIKKRTRCRECIFRCNEDQCEKVNTDEFNIMDRCDYVGIEKSVDVNGNAYKADVLLKTKDKGNPVFIEVWVTHQCTERKRKDCKVFEVKVESEDDLVSMVPEMVIEKLNESSDKIININECAVMCRDYYEEIRDDERISFSRWKKDLMKVKIGNPDKKHLYDICLECDYSVLSTYDRLFGINRNKDVKCCYNRWDCPVKRMRFSPYYPKITKYNLL